MPVCFCLLRYYVKYRCYVVYDKNGSNCTMTGSFNSFVIIIITIQDNSIQQSPYEADRLSTAYFNIFLPSKPRYPSDFLTSGFQTRMSDQM